MEALLFHSPGKASTVSKNRASSRDKTTLYYPKIVPCYSQLNRVSGKNCCCQTGKAKPSRWRLYAADGISSSVDPANAQITWQIVVGAVAGITPFIVAGIEFGKRIIAQRRCEVCGGVGAHSPGEGIFSLPGMRWVFAMAVLEEILLWLKYELQFHPDITD